MPRLDAHAAVHRRFRGSIPVAGLESPNRSHVSPFRQRVRAVLAFQHPVKRRTWRAARGSPQSLEATINPGPDPRHPSLVLWSDALELDPSRERLCDTIDESPTSATKAGNGYPQDDTQKGARRSRLRDSSHHGPSRARAVHERSVRQHRGPDPGLRTAPSGIRGGHASERQQTAAAGALTLYVTDLARLCVLAGESAMEKHTAP